LVYLINFRTLLSSSNDHVIVDAVQWLQVAK